MKSLILFLLLVIILILVAYGYLYYNRKAMKDEEVVVRRVYHTSYPRDKIIYGLSYPRVYVSPRYRRRNALRKKWGHHGKIKENFKGTAKCENVLNGGRVDPYNDAKLTKADINDDYLILPNQIPQLEF